MAACANPLANILFLSPSNIKGSREGR